MLRTQGTVGKSDESGVSRGVPVKGEGRLGMSYNTSERPGTKEGSEGAVLPTNLVL